MSRKERILVGAQAGLLVGSIALAAVLSNARDWDPPALFLLLVGLAVVSQTFRLRAKTFNISAAFLAIVLAMILMGPAPAVAIGVIAMLVDTLPRRAPWRHVLANLSTYAAFPLLGAVLFDAVGGDGAGGRPAALRAHGARAVHRHERPELPAHRHRHRRRRRAEPVERPAARVPAGAPGRVRHRPAHRRRRPGLRGPQRVRGRPHRRRRPRLPVPAADGAELDRAQGAARGPHAPARRAPGRPARHRAADAVAARQDDRAPLRRRRPLRARDRPRARPGRARAGDRPHGRPPARHRQVHLPRLHPVRGDAPVAGADGHRAPPPGAGREAGQADRGLRPDRRDHPRPPRARRRRRLSRTASRARTSRWPRASSPSPTPTTS